MFVRAEEHNFRGHGHFHLDMLRNGDVDIMRTSAFEIESLSAAAVDFTARVVLERDAVTDADEIERDLEALRHSGDGIVNERPGCAPHLPLLLLLRPFDADGQCSFHRECELDERLDGHRSRS